jgi:hypothetical protein
VANTRGYSAGSQYWEAQNHSQNVSWAGECHAWSAASILTPGAPQGGVTKGGVQFTQDDLEGLVTALYYNPTYEMLPGGTRSNTDNVNTAEYQDMNPAWMHYLLQYYLGSYNYPFIMDTSAGSQVWNFPAFAYRMWGTDNGDGSTSYTTRVWFSDARAGVATTQYFYKDYNYTLANTADGHMTGAWTGNSVADHPDFAWVPTGKAEGGGKNPYINEAIVEEILGYNV